MSGVSRIRFEYPCVTARIIARPTLTLVVTDPGKSRFRRGKSGATTV